MNVKRVRIVKFYKKYHKEIKDTLLNLPNRGFLRLEKFLNEVLYSLKEIDIINIHGEQSTNKIIDYYYDILNFIYYYRNCYFNQVDWQDRLEDLINKLEKVRIILYRKILKKSIDF